MNSDHTDSDTRYPYNVIIDLVGLRPSYKTSKANTAAARGALRASLNKLGILTEGGNQDSSNENALSSPHIMFHLEANILIAMTKDGDDAALVHLFGSLMNIEITLMSYGVPVRGVVFQESVDQIFEQGTWMTCSIDTATRLCETLRVFGIFGITKGTNNMNVRKRSKNDIPLEFPTLVPTDNGLMRLSMINWCCFFKRYADVETLLGNIRPKKHLTEYQEFLKSTQEIVKDAHKETWDYDEATFTIPPFSDN